MGLWSKVKKAAKKVAKAVRGAANQVIDLITELGHRLVGLPDFVLTLLGIMVRKKMRLQVLLMKNAAGDFLNIPEDVELMVERTQAIFDSQMNVNIVSARGAMVQRIGTIPPDQALRPHCDGEAWLEDFGDAGHFFFMQRTKSFFSFIPGYANPITAFVVEDVQGKNGCSLGPLTSYVTVDQTGIAPITGQSPSDDVVSVMGSTILAHELAHACGGLHRKKRNNLMFSGRERGVDLAKWQKAMYRNSRFIGLF